MAKKSVWFGLFVVFVLAFVVAFFGRVPLSVLFDDSLCYNCGFDWETSANWDVVRTGQVGQRVLSNGDWSFDIGGRQSQGVSLSTKRSFDNEDVRFSFVNINDLTNVARNTLCSQRGVEVSVGGCSFSLAGGTTGVLFNPKNSLVEVVTSRIDNKRFEVLLDGESKCEGVGSRKISIVRPMGDSVSCGGNLVLKSLRYRPLFGCTINDGESLAMESFVAGSKIDINSFRYGVKRFCLAHPVVITDEIKGGSDASAEPYDTLVRADSTGKPRSVIIPQGQTYSFFYIFNYKEANIQVACGRDEAFNVETNNCQGAKGIITFCSQGQYDAARGACLVFPEIKNVCEQGRLEGNVCVYNPPVQAVCKIGTYNDVTQKCHVEPATQTSTECGDASYTYNPRTQVCEALPLLVHSGDVSCSSLNGQEKIVDGVTQCVFSPEPFVECSSGFSKETIDNKQVCVGVEQPVQLQKTLFTISGYGISTIYLLVLAIIILLIAGMYWLKK